MTNVPSRALVFARLTRLPNVFTALADIALAVVVTGAEQFGFHYMLLATSSACLYTSGMVWNDYFDIEQDARLAAPADQNGKPSVALGAGRGDNTLGHLTLEHQHKSIIPRRPRLEREPGDQQSCGNVVGQVCNYTRGCADKPARIEIQCTARDDLEAAGIVRGNFRERGDSAIIPLNRDHPARACGEQRAGKPTRSGPYFDHLHAVERARSTGDARRQVKIEKKILAEGFLGSEPVAPDHLAQRRKVIDGTHQDIYACLRGLQTSSASGRDWWRDESVAASCSAAIRLAGLARPVPAMSKAVP